MSACTWPVDRTCLPVVTAPDDQVRLQGAINTAVSILWSFTGRQFGCCPRTIRPCPRNRDRPLFWLPGWSWYPELGAGVWRNVVCACGPTCQVGGPGVVHLPGPVCTVTGVTIDGAVVDSGVWVLEGDRLYARSGRWPDQHLDRPAGSPGTWSVEYLQGTAPPAGAGQMVGILALEFWNACRGEKCRLPRGVESIARQGVSMKVADPSALFSNKQTGIPEVDLWIAAVNPHRLAFPPAVLSPDHTGSGY
ncbi:hypothetical protein D5S18_22110 [Nocardia panacis]|uniref:Head-to-tail adaptor n=1 Tax=Nocardia panacis TaxID=2340916 RepID=A0A3A4KT89_9NOCA|nr:hypothetical protein [Nocardia panacis]RJO72973.1 hypothetical protein D5S18_22110 [Nocardia panacis]